jgi:hypothetical protein
MSMNRFRPFVAVLAATALAACTDSSSPTTLTVASVVVSPGTATLPALGATVQLSAQVTDVAGAVVTGRPVNWTSADAGVASVDGAGLVTGVTVGTAEITATVDGVSGSATIDVEQCAQVETVNLSPGVYKAFESFDCFIIPSGSNGDRYRVAVVWPAESAEASEVQTVTLRVGGLGVTQAPVVADVVAAPAAAAARAIRPRMDLSALRGAVRIAEATRRFHERLRAQEEELVERLPWSSFLRTSRLGAAQAVARAPSPGKVTFDISTDSECTTTPEDQKVGILVHENDDLAIYQDSIQRDTKPISVALARSMTDYYTDYGMGVIEDYFGEPSDIDQNGKLVVFASPVAADSVAAFVWSGDFFQKEGAAGETCAASNEMELVYFNTDVILNMEGDDATYQALTTMTHEAKHVVSLYNRIAASIRVGSSQFHPSWIEEGTAEIGGEMSSRAAWAAAGGPPVNTRITFDDFPRVNGSRFTVENYGLVLHLARTIWYLSSQPNGLVVSPDGAAEGHSVYGSGWTFHRWLGDAYGGAANAPYGDAALFRALNDSLAPRGTSGLAQQTGKSFLELVEEFIVTVNLHETDAPAPLLDFTTVNYVSATDLFCNPNPVGDFPWPITATGTPIDCDAQPRIEEDSNPAATLQTATYTGDIGASGVRIHEFVSNGTGTGAQFQLEMSQPGKIYVIRLR